MPIPLPFLRPVDDAYAAHEHLVRRTAGRFARRHRVPFDDALAEATFHFLRAARGHDPAKGTIEARIVFVVWHGLLDWVRDAAIDAARLPTVSAARARGGDRVPVVDTLPAAADPESLDIDDFVQDFGLDARVVIRLLAETPGDLLGLLRDARPNAQAVRHLLKRFLAEVGWDHHRAEAAFTEIGALL